MATRAMTIETAESEEIGLERLLCHRVTALSKIMNRLAGRYLAAEYGLTIAEWWILCQLDQHSPRTLRWISEATMTDKAQLSRAAASLVDRGYVTRRTDPSDARSILFSITEAGCEISQTSGAARRDVDRQMLGLLPEEDREALCRSLDRITEFLRSEEESIEFRVADGASAD
jgi:DNA-binding MarR family transcriptional regulator